MRSISTKRSSPARAFGAALSLIVLALVAAPARVDAQSACTLAGTPTSFEPNPPGANRPGSLAGSYSTSLVVYHNAAGAPRMMMNETFGYSILDLTNPGSPMALKYDDFRLDPANSYTNPLHQGGDGQSAIQTFGVSPDGQRAAFSVNGPFDPPWHTIGAKPDQTDGFGLWGDFAPNRALSTVIQHVAGRYIAYAIHGTNNMTAADITNLPSALAPYDQCVAGTSCQPYDTTPFPSAYAPPLVLAGNYLVYKTGTYPNPGITVADASNPGPAGGITQPFKATAFPSLTADRFGRANFTAAVDPGDPTKLWVLVEIFAATGDNSPTYRLVSVTGAGTGTLTVTAAPGVFRIPAAGGESWDLAGNAASLVAVNGNLFAVMWAQRTSPTAQYGFYATTVAAWSQAAPVGLPFQPVSAAGFQLPSTTSSVLAASAGSANAFQYFPTGTNAYAVPLSCAPVNPKATSSLTAFSYSVAVPNNGTVFIGDKVDVTPSVVPSPGTEPLVGGGGWGAAGWNLDIDFHANNSLEDLGASAIPRIKQPDNASVVIGGAGAAPATFSFVGPCDPAFGGSVSPTTGTNCWTSVKSNGSFGGPDFTGAELPGTTKPTTIAVEANNRFGSSGMATLTINWKVPAAKVAAVQILTGASLQSTSDGHPTSTGYKWYFGETPTTLVSAACNTSSCPPTIGIAGTHYYWLTATYDNGFSTPDYVQGTTNGLPFTITPFVAAFTVGSSATGPITALIGSNVNVVNNSLRGSGISATYQYSLCGPFVSGGCADNYQTFSIGDTPGALGSITLPGTVGTYALKIKATYTGGVTVFWPDPVGTSYFTINAVNIPVTTASINPNPVTAGNSVTLTCSAVGGSGTYSSYAWTSNGNQFSTQNPYTFNATNSGSTDIQLPVQCTATDTNGQTSQGSPVQTLTIHPSPKPVVSASVSPQTVTGGNPAMFSCSATGGTGVYTYAWYGSVGGVLSTNSTFNVTFTNTSGSAQAQTLTCAVTDSAGQSGQASATLTVNSSSSGPPNGSLSVSASVSPNPVGTGQTATFSCSVSGGSGSYTYAWYGAVGGTISTQQSFPYTPPANTAGTALPLTCSATDTSNNKTGQSTATLTIIASGPSCPVVDFKMYASSGTQLVAAQGPLGITIPPSTPMGDLLAFSITNGNSSQFDWNFGDGTAHKTGSAADGTVTFARHAFLSGGNFTVTLRPLYSDGSGFCGGISYPITVVGPTGQFSAAYQDGAPITYAQVTAYKAVVFTALDATSLVDAGSYAWDFGDGAVSNGSSTALHAYAPGTWTAKLTVMKNGLSVSTTLALTVPAPPEPPKWVVPGMAYVSGQVAGTTWQSDVTITNPSTLITANYAVTFLDARNPVTDYSQLTWLQFSVPPLGSIASSNVLASVFGQPLGAYGALMVRGDVAPLPPVITARTFNNQVDQGKGTFGLSVPETPVSGGVSTQAAPASSILIGLKQNDAAYTNIGLVNLHNDWATVELDFSDGLTAADLGTLRLQINPYQSTQINKALLDGRFVPAAGAGSLATSDLYTVKVKIVEGTAVYPYATVIDTGTTDPIVVTPTATPSNSYRIPGVVRQTGANGELWRSRVTVTNPSTASRKVHIVYSYQACNASGNCSSLNSTAGDVNFAPGTTQSWDDFVNVWLTYKGFITVNDATNYQYSFLDVSPGDANSDPLVVLGETYNATPVGHVGLQIPGFTPVDGASRAGAYKRLTLAGLAQTSTYRSNLALFILSGSTGKWANVHLLSAQGTVLKDIPVYLDGFVQLSAGTLFSGVSGDLSRVSAVIDNMDDGVTVGAYATIIDNMSGDATFVKATPAP